MKRTSEADQCVRKGVDEEPPSGRVIATAGRVRDESVPSQNRRYYELVHLHGYHDDTTSHRGPAAGDEIFEELKKDGGVHPRGAARRPNLYGSPMSHPRASAP